MAKHEAIVDAGLGRLRPILMTSADDDPGAAADGHGSRARAPSCAARWPITVIGGLAAATGLTLLVIPIVYSLVDRKVYAADAAQRESAGGGCRASIAAGELAG